MESRWYVLSKPLGLREYYGPAAMENRGSISTEFTQNAITLLNRVNRFLTVFGEYRKVLAGWKPVLLNQVWKEAVRPSRHFTMEAIDLHDPEGDLDQFIMDNQKLLEQCALWAEHPATTKGWSHLQSVAPKSGRRIFYP